MKSRLVIMRGLYFLAVIFAATIIDEIILTVNIVKHTLHSLRNLKVFPGPLAFCKKAVERVNSQKNILNS